MARKRMKNEEETTNAIRKRPTKPGLGQCHTFHSTPHFGVGGKMDQGFNGRIYFFRTNLSPFPGTGILPSP